MSGALLVADISSMSVFRGEIGTKLLLTELLPVQKTQDQTIQGKQDQIFTSF